MKKNNFLIKIEKKNNIVIKYILYHCVYLLLFLKMFYLFFFINLDF